VPVRRNHGIEQDLARDRTHKCVHLAIFHFGQIYSTNGQIRSPLRDGQTSPHRPRLVVSRITCPPLSSHEQLCDRSHFDVSFPQFSVTTVQMCGYNLDRTFPQLLFRHKPSGVLTVNEKSGRPATPTRREGSLTGSATIHAQSPNNPPNNPRVPCPTDTLPARSPLRPPPSH
jgi:hypothetical protein